jgi:hypothetical protein
VYELCRRDTAEQSVIAVNIYDLAHVPDEVLNRAIEVTNDLYAGTGLGLKWVRQTFRPDCRGKVTITVRGTVLPRYRCGYYPRRYPT